MIKKIIIEEILRARKAHEQWVARAEDLISGLPVYEDMIPLSPDTCRFGKWFREKCANLHKIPRLALSLKHIETLHNELHYTYFQIYKIYFIDSKRSWFLSILTSKYKEPSLAQKKLAAEYFEELEDNSIRLLTELRMFERDIQNTKEIFLEKNYEADAEMLSRYSPST